MTNEQIIKEAIEKIKGTAIGNAWLGEIEANSEEWIDLYKFHYMSLLTNHDFAKEFWGERSIFFHNEVMVFVDERSGADYMPRDNETQPIFLWQYRLKQMVLEEEPLKYLEKFLK